MTGLSRLAWFTAAAACWLVSLAPAAPIVDASHLLADPDTSWDLRPNNFWGQSFTVGTEGLLSQIDVQIGKFEGATGDVRLDLTPIVDGVPTATTAGSLYVTSIPIDSIPLFPESDGGPTSLVSVDVSEAGIHAKPGDQYAITLRRSGSFPLVGWSGGSGGYGDGQGYFRSLLNQPWTGTSQDLGFQAWVDPEPTLPYKHRIDPAFDGTYQVGATNEIIEGESGLLAGGFPGDSDFPEERPILEFPLDGLPEGVVIQGVTLDLDFYGSSGSPRLELTGYAGDGVFTLTDGTAAGSVLATTDPVNASSPDDISLNRAVVESLIGQSSHLGVRVRSMDVPLYVAFYSKETAEGTFSLAPPRLVIEYTPAPKSADYNADGYVDAAD